MSSPAIPVRTPTEPEAFPTHGDRVPIPSPMIRIVIADDHAIVRAGLLRLLASERDFKVVGEAASAAEAVRAVLDLRPDLLLLDVSMPGGSGIEALEPLRDVPGLKIILLTANVEKADMVRALSLGVRGVVLKDAATDLLFKSIRAVMAGEYWIGRETVADLARHMGRLANGENPLADRRSFGLTDRERDIVGAVVAGLGNREIARKLKIAEDTVKHHLTNIFDKTGVSNRLELALFALHHRLVERR